LARLGTLVGRAVARCAARAGDLRVTHAALLQLAHQFEPPTDPTDTTGPTCEPPPSGTAVRARVEACLDELTARCHDGHGDEIAAWLRPKVEHVATVLRRLGDGLYHCYDVPGLPRTDNDMEQFYRRLKTEQRRITGRKRADAFVVRVGGFAVYATAMATATAAGAATEATLLQQLGAVPADEWQRERRTLRANQDRQTKMRRFRLHPDAYLAALEARWTCLTLPP
jgi:hypothetical protein